ncbi:MAG: plasmid pRiA4b ORF-3 family protein [Bacteroidales bacterium]|jgi:hypothetical protein|nr:plasmid pRiA4b ORF-3 family protein [Bacteroidales bacterium]
MQRYYYKFRVYFDDIEDFLRDIEILSTDHFESFHAALIEAVGLKRGELASFSVCDPKWNKQKEITLIDMGDDDLLENPEYEEGDGFSTKSHLPQFVMGSSVLKDFIADPHQRLIYEYDFLNPKVFYIELLKTLQVPEYADNNDFPRCVYKSGELPIEAPKLGDSIGDESYLEEEDLDNDNGFEDGFNDEDLDLNAVDDYPGY